MSYVDQTYYTDTYYGKDAGMDFDRYAMRASDDIDAACLQSIVLPELDAMQLTLLKKATCAQIEWYVVQGDVYNDQPSNGGNETIGGYSNSRGGNQSSSGRPSIALSPRAMAYLEQTGLTNHAAKIVGRWAVGALDE